MANPIEVNISGLDQIQKRLEELRGPLARKAMRAGLKAGAAPVLSAIVQEAPKDSGFMAEHFNVKYSTKQEGTIGKAFIGPEGKMFYPGEHARTVRIGGKTFKAKHLAVATVVRFHEFGTRFMAANPFMSGAFKAKQQAALDAIIAALKKNLGLS